MKNSSHSEYIDSPESDYLFIDVSQIPQSGNGLLTAIDIYEEEIIAVFHGEVLTTKEAKRRAEINQDQYFISLLDGTILDSKHVFCFAKYANDASGDVPTAFRNNARITTDDDGRVCLVAQRDIRSGEEIFCGYGSRYWKKHRKALLA